MSITSVTEDRTALLAQLSGAGGNGKASASATAEMSDRFLKLLVTQLKNQDPMNPMENAELTSQLAQMSTVEGISELNESMNGLLSQYRSSQVLQGAALVGRQVLAEGDHLQLTSAGAMAGVDLADAVDSLQIKVLDANDSVVRTLNLGKQDAGLVRFGWDGKDTAGNALAEGEYSFEVEAKAADNVVTATAYALGSVLSVSLNAGDMEAEISGLGARSLGQVRQIY